MAVHLSIPGSPGPPPCLASPMEAQNLRGGTVSVLRFGDLNENPPFPCPGSRASVSWAQAQQPGHHVRLNPADWALTA
jgi:hypothetical protein